MKYNYDEDGVAFYFFLLTLLAIYVLVGGYLWIIPFLTQHLKTGKQRATGDRTSCNKGDENETGAATLTTNCHCEGCEAKVLIKEKLEKPLVENNVSATTKRLLSTILGKLGSPSAANLKFKVWSVIVAGIVLAFVLIRVWGAQLSHVHYDPFEILGIKESASDKEIKRAFNKLSLIWHPDKVTDPADKTKAEARFLEINKAYKALTDPVARKNWEEYGNPDGPKGFSLGIALPAFLVMEGGWGRAAVLTIYALVLGFLLPWFVYRRYHSQKALTASRIKHASMEAFFKELKADTNPPRLLELLCLPREYLDLPWSIGADPGQVKKITDRVVALFPTNGPFTYTPLKKATLANAHSLAPLVHALLWAHLHRIPLIGGESENNKGENYVDWSTIKLDQGLVLAMAHHLVYALMQISVARDWFAPTNHLQHIAQSLVQGMWPDLPGYGPLLNLPYLTAEEHLKHFRAGKRNIQTPLQLALMEDTERRNLLRALNDTQYAIMMRICLDLFQIELESATFKVLGQENIYPGNLITCQVKVTLKTIADQVEEHRRTLAELDKDSTKGTNDKVPLTPASTNSTSHEVLAFEFDDEGNLIEGGAGGSVSNSKDSPIISLPPTSAFCPADLGLDLVHAPFYTPVDKRPSWWIMLLTPDQGSILCAPQRITFDSSKGQSGISSNLSGLVSFQFNAPPHHGEVRLYASARADCLVGMDHDLRCTFKVLPPKSDGKSAVKGAKHQYSSNSSSEGEEKWGLSDESEGLGAVIDNDFNQ